jgi:hypothetical protein
VKITAGVQRKNTLHFARKCPDLVWRYLNLQEKNFKNEKYPFYLFCPVWESLSLTDFN